MGKVGYTFGEQGAPGNQKTNLKFRGFYVMLMSHGSRLMSHGSRRRLDQGWMADVAALKARLASVKDRSLPSSPQQLSPATVGTGPIARQWSAKTSAIIDRISGLSGGCLTAKKPQAPVPPAPPRRPPNDHRVAAHHRIPCCFAAPYTSAGPAPDVLQV